MSKPEASVSTGAFFHLEHDRIRLLFLLSVLNYWDLYGDFVEEHVEGKSTSRQRATDEEWIADIDRALGISQGSQVDGLATPTVDGGSKEGSHAK